MSGTNRAEALRERRDEALEAAKALLRRVSGVFSDEAALQRAIDAELARRDADYDREVACGAGRADFMLRMNDCRVAVECKVRGASSLQVARQLMGYAEDPDVDAVLLVTTRLKHWVPPTVRDKPCGLLCLMTL